MAPERSTYEQWYRQVNAAVMARMGLRADDLADQPWFAWFTDGLTPVAAAVAALDSEELS